MKARWAIAAVGCATLVFGVTGCGDDGDKSADEEIEDALDDIEEGEVPDIPGRENACEVVDRDDVEAAFGGEVGEGAEDIAGCNFEVTGSDLGLDGSVSVRIELTGGLDPEELFRLSQEAYEAGAVEDVDGVGDRAYYVEQVGAVTVLEGDTVFTVQGAFTDIGSETMLDQEDLQARVVELAEVVAGRV